MDLGLLLETPDAVEMAVDALPRIRHSNILKLKAIQLVASDGYDIACRQF